MKKRTADVCAKINLFLDITGKRPDGYHDLKSVMQSVSLVDTISVAIDEDSASDNISVVCTVPEIPTDRDNTAFRAAELFRNAVGLRLPISICIEKHIPSQAGLGGGSADAATVLYLCNSLCGGILSFDRLCSIAGQVGSDVPFFLFGGTCLVEGRGERVVRIPSAPFCRILIVKDETGMSTGDAYRLYDGSDIPTVDLSPDFIRCSNVERYYSNLYNVFEKVVFPVRPGCEKIKSFLLENGAFSALMSGSGTSVYGVFFDEKKAGSAIAVLREKGYRCFLTVPTDRSISIRR